LLGSYVYLVENSAILKRENLYKITLAVFKDWSDGGESFDEV